jgi:Fe-S oxidoreductase
MATLDLRKPEFWDLSAVDKELRRVYDICGGCRRCLPLCPSFKVLFDRMDIEAVEGDAAGELDTSFTRPIGPVTYHVPCHLRAQNIGHKSADMLRAIPGASVTVVEKCSAVDGTWGFKKEYYELSLKVAKPLFDAIAGGAPTSATDCPLAALQIEQGTGQKPKHPIEVLASAYGLEE